MGRHSEPYRLKQKGKYWYYKTPDMSSFKTTGETTKAMAKHKVQQLLQKGLDGKPNPLFRDYAEPFFDWDRCPHATRLRAEGKPIGERYCRNERRFLVKYVLNSSIGRKRMGDITRGDLIDFRSELQAQGLSGNIINGTMKAVKVIFGEAVYREVIPYSPADKLGNVRTGNREAGIFTEDELKALFEDPENGLLWRTPSDYICFLIAAATGMRKGEVLALRWRNVHVEERYIHICEAWKDDRHTVAGLPKSRKARDTAIPQYLAYRLAEYYKATPYKAPNDLVVCDDEGRAYSDWHWQRVFENALHGIGITEEEREERHLKPHSFRHTLNTLMREKGLNPDLIRLMLGWSDISIQNNYTHFDIVRLIKQGELVDSVVFGQKLLSDSQDYLSTEEINDNAKR